MAKDLQLLEALREETMLLWSLLGLFVLRSLSCPRLAACFSYSGEHPVRRKGKSHRCNLGDGSIAMSGR